jgi:outer membrane protein OmpA-like peptidoglycan-associated protein
MVMMARIARIFLILASFPGMALAAAAKPEIQPPPYVEGMPQYNITAGKNIEFDAFTFNTGRQLVEEVEGRIWQRRYKLKSGLPQNPSSLQVARNYSNLLRSLGAANVVEMNYSDAAKRMYGSTGSRVVFGSFVKDKKEIRVEMQVNGGASEYTLTILEPDAMVQDVGEAPTADEMLRAIRDQGHIAMYINFDTGKWTIKPESLPIIEQVAAMLKSASDLRLRIEGHTDSAGTPASNKTLSDNRAKAVVDAIVVKGIAAGRLSAVGMGQEKPIADNTTEEGKAKNRRVELVRQ